MAPSRPAAKQGPRGVDGSGSPRAAVRELSGLDEERQREREREHRAAPRLGMGFARRRGGGRRPHRVAPTAATERDDVGTPPTSHESPRLRSCGALRRPHLPRRRRALGRGPWCCETERRVARGAAALGDERFRRARGRRPSESADGRRDHDGGGHRGPVSRHSPRGPRLDVVRNDRRRRQRDCDGGSISTAADGGAAGAPPTARTGLGRSATRRADATLPRRGEGPPAPSPGATPARRPRRRPRVRRARARRRRAREGRRRGRWSPKPPPRPPIEASHRQAVSQTHRQAHVAPRFRGRSCASHARGRGFESLCAHHVPSAFFAGFWRLCASSGAPSGAAAALRSSAAFCPVLAGDLADFWHSAPGVPAARSAAPWRSSRWASV